MSAQCIRQAGSRGVSLAADVIGAPDGYPVVLLPGAGQTRRSWRSVACRLGRKGYRAMCVDLRGHGQSDWAADGDYSVDAFVEDVVAVANAQPSPPVLIGASIGGIAAAIAVGEREEQLARGLVLVDVVPDMETEGLERIRGFMAAGAAGFGSLEEAAAAVAAYLPHRPRPASSDGLMHNLRRGSDQRLYWHWDPAFHAGSGGRDRGGMLERMRCAAERVRIPTLLVRGLRSEVVDEAGVRRLLSLMPHAEYVEVPGASHMVAGDANDAFAVSIVSFLERIAPRPEVIPA